MYQVTAKFTRPSTDVPFYSQLGTDEESVRFVDHWHKTYKITGKLVSLEQQLSADQLVQTTVFNWVNEQAYNEAMADPIVANKWAIRAAYNDSNNITLTEKTAVVV